MSRESGAEKWQRWHFTRYMHYPSLGFASLVLLLGVVLGRSVSAQETQVLSPGHVKFRAQQAGILNDGEGQMSLDDVTNEAAAFEPLLGPVFSLGLLNQPVWVRLILDNQSDVGEWVLDLGNPRLGRVDLWLLDEDGEVVYNHAMGVQLGPEARTFPYPAPAFALSIPAGTQCTVYLRIHHLGALLFQAAFFTSEAFVDQSFYLWFHNFVLEGALLALAVFALLIYAGLRERSYLWHALLALSFFMFAISASGTAHLVLWPRALWWGDHAPTFFGMLTGATAAPSAAVFFGARRSHPRLNALANALAILALFTAVLALTDWNFKYVLRGVVSLFAPCIVFVLSFQAMLHGYRPAYYFFCGWSIAVIGAVAAILRDLGYSVLPAFSHVELTWVFFIGIIAWGFALTERIREQQRHNREVLEAAVDERTRELREALGQVKTLSGLVPICSHCKKVRDDRGFWREVEAYVSQHTDADFSHGVCPGCIEKHYPRYHAKLMAKKEEQEREGKRTLPES